MKKIMRDQRNGRISGVCAGLSEYFEIDVNLVRLIAIVLGMSGSGIVLYLIATIFLPNKTMEI